MLVDLTSHNLVIREWINGILFPLSACLSLLITYSLYGAWRDNGDNWLKAKGVDTALAFWGVFTFAAIWTGSVYFALRMKARGLAYTLKTERAVEFAWLISGSALAIVILYTIYLFTPPKWGHKFWVGSLIFTGVFLILTRLASAHGY